MVIIAEGRNKSTFAAANIYFFSLSLFIVTLYSPIAQINNVSIILLGLVWLLSGGLKNLKQLGSNKTALALIVYYVFGAITVLYSHNKANGAKWMEYHSPLIYLSLFLGASFITLAEKRKLLLLFAWVTSAAALLAFLFGVVRTIQTGDSESLYNDGLGTLFDKQAVYFAMYGNFAIAIFLYFLHNKWLTRDLFRKMAVSSIFLLTVLNYFLASRIGMFVLALLYVGYVFILIYRQKRILTGLILLLGIFIGGFLFTQLFPKAALRLANITETTYDYKSLNGGDHYNAEIKGGEWNSMNTRLAVWHCATEVAREHWLTGVGAGDVEDKLQEKYREKQFVFALRYNLNAHNQYLDVLISSGVGGVILFLITFFLLPFSRARVEKDYLLWFFIASLAIYMITEVMLNRNQGVAFIAFFLTLLSVKTEEKLPLAL